MRGIARLLALVLLGLMILLGFTGCVVSLGPDDGSPVYYPGPPVYYPPPVIIAPYYAYPYYYPSYVYPIYPYRYCCFRHYRHYRR